MLKKFSIILISCLLGIILFEFLYKNLQLDNVSKQYRTLLNIYSLWKDEKQNGGRINLENKIWTYDRNNKFHHRIFIKKDDKWIEEFQYKFITNNYGLNQNIDLIKNKKSIIFFGTSVSEGWGAKPWFNELQNEINTNYQLINGSLHGTGVYSWRILHDYLIREEIQIEKIILFLQNDFWVNVPKTITQNQIDCLRDHKLCTNASSFLQYRMPENEKEIFQYLNELDKKRNDTITSKVAYIRSFKEFLFYLREMLPATYQIYRFAIIKLNKKKNEKEIKKFINEYKDNMIVIHLPQEKEFSEGKLDKDSLSLIKFIKKNGGQVFNSFEKCEKYSADDYFFYDGHPNIKGYNKLKICSKKVLEEYLLN